MNAERLIAMSPAAFEYWRMDSRFGGVTELRATLEAVRTYHHPPQLCDVVAERIEAIEREIDLAENGPNE